MTGAERTFLRHRIDQARRLLVDTTDCGDSASMFAYKHGCRCRSCRALVAAYKRRYRAANRAVNAAHRREYKQRRRLNASAEALRP